MHVIFYDPDLKIQEVKRKVLIAETIPFYLNKLEAIAKANNGHLALKRTTWADVYLASVKGYMSHMAKVDLTANHPNLKKVVDDVFANKNIKAWVEKRPKTEF